MLHPCSLTDPTDLETCALFPEGVHVCEADASHWDPAGLVALDSRTGLVNMPPWSDDMKDHLVCVCHTCVGEQLDTNVTCAPCAIQHPHMRECPNIRPTTCTNCGTQRWTAAAVVEHVRGHIITPTVPGKKGAEQLRAAVEQLISANGGPAAVFDLAAFKEVERGIHFPPHDTSGSQP